MLRLEPAAARPVPPNVGDTDRDARKRGDADSQPDELATAFESCAGDVDGSFGRVGRRVRNQREIT